MTTNSFFSFLSVSKSLLIVLGTLPLPDINGRGKYRFAGIPKHSRKGSENLWFSLLSTALEFSVLVCLLSCFIFPLSNGAGSAGRAPAHPAFLRQQAAPVNVFTTLFRFSANCTGRRFALVKAHGFIGLPAFLNWKKPNLVLPAHR